MKKYYILLIALVVLVSSCEDFLSEPPNKTTTVVPTTTEHLEFLLNDYSQFATEANAEIIYGSDDFGLLDTLYDNNPAIYDVTTGHYATWDVDYLPVQEDRPYFSNEWKKIFSANMVLEDIERVDGTAEEKAALKAEAHFIRAYSYYQLVNTFCLPYATENLSEMGLPLKKATNFEESAERATLEETWNFILSDLEEAMLLDRELELKDAGYRSWRASTPAINAFAARVYLTMNDYPMAQSYAQAALDDHSELMDYNTDMYYSDQVIEFPDENGDPYRLWYPYTFEGQGGTLQRMGWNELYYFRFLDNMRWNFWPSEELLALYDATNDLRYRYHMVEGYSYDRGATMQYPAYIFFFDKIPSGPTTAEMLLIKAECQARNGQWADGISTANILRAKRMDNTAAPEVINLSATNQDEAISKILEERRREMPFTQRFFDVRRYNNNEYAGDDVEMTRYFYPIGEFVIETSQGLQTLVLDKKSRKFARPLPNTDIIATEGVMKQNIY